MSDRCPTCGRRQKRGSQQNAFYWVLLSRIAAKLKPEGQTYSASTWHEYMKSRFLGCEDVRLPNKKVLAIPRSSADLDISEFAEYVQKVEAWAAEHDVHLDELAA